MNLTKMFRRQKSACIPSRIALGIIVLCAGTLAHASLIGLTIDPTFDPSLNAADQAAINAAISSIEANITSPNDITVSIYFNSMNSGLGESNTTEYEPSYIQYYDAYSGIATQPNQIELPAPITVLPMIVALGATKASTAMVGRMPPKGRIRPVMELSSQALVPSSMERGEPERKPRWASNRRSRESTDLPCGIWRTGSRHD